MGGGRTPLARVLLLLLLLAVVARGEPLEEIRRGDFEAAQRQLESLPKTPAHQRQAVACLIGLGRTREALSLAESLPPAPTDEEQLSLEVLAMLAARDDSQLDSFLRHLARGEALLGRVKSPYGELAAFVLETERFEADLETHPELELGPIARRHEQTWRHLQALALPADLGPATLEPALLGQLAWNSWLLNVGLVFREQAAPYFLTTTEAEGAILERLAKAQPDLFLSSWREYQEFWVTMKLAFGQLEAARQLVARLEGLQTGADTSEERGRQVKLHLARAELALAEGKNDQVEREFAAAQSLLAGLQNGDIACLANWAEVDYLFKQQPPGWKERVEARLDELSRRPGADRLGVLLPNASRRFQLRLAQGRNQEAEQELKGLLDRWSREVSDMGGSRQAVEHQVKMVEALFAGMARQQLLEGDGLGAFVTLSRLQQLQLASTFDREDLNRQVAPQDRALLTQAEAARRQMTARQSELARLEREGAPPPRIKQAAQLVADSRQSYYQALDDLSRRYPAFARLDIQPINFPKLQRSLPEDTLVVQLFPTEEELFLLEVSRESLKIRRVALPRAQLDEAVATVRQQIVQAGRNPASFDWSKPETAPLRTGLGLLEQALVQPLEADLAGKSVLAFIPYGSSSYLPYQALRNEATGKFLVERFQVVTLTKSSDLEQIFGPPAGRSGSLVAMGDPDGSLPGADEEVRALGRLFPGATVMVGSEVEPGRLELVKAPQVAFLHLATHGVLDPAEPRQSYLVMGGGKKLSVADIAGYRLDSPEGDISLVTLSACQTALGEKNGPDGSDLRSLADAFSFAGCRSMLASLWKVDDRSTRELMVNFYTHLQAGETKAEALRQAQVEMLKKNANPYAWAPFILIGDWR